MRFPSLVQPAFCRTPVVVLIDREGLTEYGEPLPQYRYEGCCNLQDKAKTVLTADKKLITLSGTALFIGDICPELSHITGGTLTVFGSERQIYEGRKARNPDGSVNFTEISLC